MASAIAVEDAVPSSPPGLDSSRSSAKSSSITSTQNRDSIQDVSHFEDISLTDSSSASVFDPLPLDMSKPRSSTRLDFARSPLTSLSSPNLPNIGAFPTSSRHGHSPQIQRRASWLRSPATLTSSPQSTPALSPASPRTREPRFPILTRSQTQGYPNGLAVENIPPSLPRRSSWQPSRRRKSAKELEAEYDDLDEELPDDAIVWNIPLSPRPKEKSELDFLAPLSAVTTSESIQDDLPSPLQRPALANSRTQSWENALVGLPRDIQKLTTDLDMHADTLGPQTLSQPKDRPMTLPPLRKGDNLVDPLPASQEKEKFLTRTRPSWLPPKNPKEEKKHLKEYQKMMAIFYESERKKSIRKTKSVANFTIETGASVETWNTEILNNWDNAMRTKKTRDLWWGGIPASARRQVWAKAIGNDLHLSKASYNAALARAGRVGRGLRLQKSANQAILSDVASTFPSIKMFQSAQRLHDPLMNVLHAYAAYRSDADYIRGTSGVAALLLHVTEGNEEEAFIGLANMMNRPVSLVYCLGDSAGIHEIEKRVHNLVRNKMPSLGEHFSRLAGGSHLDPASHHQGEYSGWLDLICTSLFTGVLSFHDCLRIWDILVFEGDSFLVRAVVGLLHTIEGKLYGSDIVEIDRLLGWQAWSRRRNTDFTDGLNTGGVESLLKAIKWASKENSSISLPPAAAGR